MLALTIHQPFASLILGGFKTAEYRSRPCSHRGLLAIHAGRAYPSPATLDLARSLLPEPVDPALFLQWAMRQPRGVVLGQVRITGCVPADPSSPWFRFGAWAWLLADPSPWPRPVRVRGQLGLWRLPSSLVPASSPALFS